MTNAPKRIWIETGDDCPYFYDEHELSEAGSPVIEYIRANLVEAEGALEIIADLISEQGAGRRYQDTRNGWAGVADEIKDAADTAISKIREGRE